jgi:hypothetical protein
MKVPCPVAFLLGWDCQRQQEGDPCKGLRWDEQAGRFFCLAVESEPERTRERLKESMAIGAGCSSSLCNQQRDAARRGELKAYLEGLKRRG